MSEKHSPTSDATALDRLIEHLDMIRELVWECAPKRKDDLMAHLTTAIKRTRDIRGAVPPVPVEGLDLDALAREIADRLWTSGDGTRAYRLVLWLNGREVAGWGFEPAVDQIKNVLRVRLAAVEGAPTAAPRREPEA